MQYENADLYMQGKIFTKESILQVFWLPNFYGKVIRKFE